MYPVVSWDGLAIGAGNVGPVAKRLMELLEGEAFGQAPGDPADFIDVNYED